MHASPALATMRTALANTFALYVNGVRRAVSGSHASQAPDAPDPLKRYAGAPRPLSGADDLPGIISKMPLGAEDGAEMPAAGAKVDLVAQGRSQLAEPEGTTGIETWLMRPAGSRFGFRTEEHPERDRAPSGLALLSAAVVFCYMTQLLRYTEYLKYRVRAIRVVQYNPFRLTGSAEDGNLAGQADPVDTHLFLHGDEPDEVMQKLLVMGAQTCYLHAALRSTLEPEIAVFVTR
jgi:hypothetical protein